MSRNFHFFKVLFYFFIYIFCEKLRSEGGHNTLFINKNVYFVLLTVIQFVLNTYKPDK